jgi:drug/metabolite transporter (DMT)-like permease
MGILLGGIIPAFLFGFSGVLQKAAMRAGIGPGFLMITACVGIFLTSIILQWVMPDKALPAKSIGFALAMGAVWAAGTGLIAISLRNYGMAISKLVPLYNMNTLVAVLISLAVFAEWKDLNVPKLLVGAALIVIGGILVANA